MANDSLPVLDANEGIVDVGYVLYDPDLKTYCMANRGLYRTFDGALKCCDYNHYPLKVRIVADQPERSNK